MASTLLLPQRHTHLEVTNMAAEANRTLRLNRPYGPVVVDLWEPRTPAGVAPILLIHGWGASGFYWQQTAAALAETAQVIVPDLPGTGRSQPVRRTLNLFDEVTVLLELIDELQIERLQIVGHSMGGAMALLVADARPGLVERLVLTSTCFFLNQRQERIYQSIMQVSFLTMRFRPGWLADLPGVAQLVAKRFFYRVPDDPSLLRQGLLDYLQLDYATAVACANDATDPAIPAAGSRVQAPTLLIACRQDEVMPVENVDYTATIMPNCTVRWIEECGHLPMVEKVGEYLGLLRGFLSL
jgi:pimeloyl-ACP methyl ester carboxylesterase